MCSIDTNFTSTSLQLTTVCVRKNDIAMNGILTHWGPVTHIGVGNLTVIDPDNGLSPDRRQAIIRTNVGILLIEPLRTNFSEIFIEIHTFSFKEMHLKISSGKWRPFCLGLNMWWPGWATSIRSPFCDSKYIFCLQFIALSRMYVFIVTEILLTKISSIWHIKEIFVINSGPANEQHFANITIFPFHELCPNAVWQKFSREFWIALSFTQNILIEPGIASLMKYTVKSDYTNGYFLT